MKKAAGDLDSSEQKSAGLNGKSVQEVSKQKRASSGRHAKTDVRYWEQVLLQPTYTRDGQLRKVGEWAVKIQHLGRRETFSLAGANKANAASRAKEIYLSLRSAGWDATLKKLKPEMA